MSSERWKYGTVVGYLDSDWIAMVISDSTIDQTVRMITLCPDTRCAPDDFYGIGIVWPWYKHLGMASWTVIDDPKA